MRQIKIYSTVGISATITTNVTTLGELLPLMMEQNVNTSGVKMMIGETRNEISHNEAVLPAGDFRLYLMPEKTKSGSFVSDSNGYNKTQLFSAAASNFESLGKLFRGLADIASKEQALSRTPQISSEEKDAIEDMLALRGNIA